MQGETLEAKERWLAELQEKYPDEVDVEAHVVILRALAHSHQAGSPQRAENYLLRMPIEPSDECYHAILEAWAKSNRRHEDPSIIVIRAQRWFDKIREPKLEHYHSFLDTISKGRSSLNNKTRLKQLLTDHASKAEEVFRSMSERGVVPDTQVYNYVIRAWSRVRQDPELMTVKVAEWLSKMEKVQQENPSGPVQPNTKSYAMMMDAYAVLAAYRARSGEKDAGLAEIEQVEAILKYLHELQQNGYPGVVPNTVVYNILLSAYARISSYNHPEAPLMAEQVLRRMTAIGKDSSPDYLSFSKVIVAWCNSNRQIAGKRAAYWLDKLWDLYEEEGRDERLRPKISNYNMVMKSCRHDPPQMEKVFQELLRAEASEAEAYLFPNTDSFSFLISAWAGKDINRAVMWLEELMRREAKSAIHPTTKAPTTTPDLFEVILRSATENPSLENLAHGTKVFEYFRSSRHPLSVMSYVWLLQLGLHALSEPEHDQDRGTFLSEIIEGCRNNGLVSNVFLHQLGNGKVYYNGWTVEECKKVVKQYFSDWPLPSTWTRNVSESRYLPKKSDTYRIDQEVHCHSSREKAKVS
jgi:hypothetical protein